MKQRAISGGDVLLPPEIWTEILTKLPVNSILRCRSVCKSWYSLISSPNFTSHHSLRTLNSNNNRVLIKLYDAITNRSSFISADDSLAQSREPRDIAHHFRSGKYDLEIVGSCNGLICLYKSEDSAHTYVHSTLVVWNPAIRKLIELPSPGYRRPVKIWGFGYESAVECEVLNLRDGYWRLISASTGAGCVVPPWTVSEGPAECYLNGAVHWSGPRRGSGMVVLSFNMSDEVFREISMPSLAQLTGDDHGRNGDVSTKCVSLGGLLHLVVCKTAENYYNGGVVSVWVMKEYGVSESWARLRYVDLQPSNALIRTDSLFLWGNGEVFMVQDDIAVLPHEDDEDVDDEYYIGKMVLVSFNPESRTSRHLCIDKCFMGVCLYTDSLALL